MIGYLLFFLSSIFAFGIFCDSYDEAVSLIYIFLDIDDLKKLRIVGKSHYLQLFSSVNFIRA